MIGQHHIERFARMAWRVSKSDWTLAMIGMMLPLIGIIAVLNQ